MTENNLKACSREKTRLIYEYSSNDMYPCNVCAITKQSSAVCVLFLIKLRWPKKKSVYDKVLQVLWLDQKISCLLKHLKRQIKSNANQLFSGSHTSFTRLRLLTECESTCM